MVCESRATRCAADTRMDGARRARQPQLCVSQKQSIKYRGFSSFISVSPLCLLQVVGRSSAHISPTSESLCRESRFGDSYETTSVERTEGLRPEAHQRCRHKVVWKASFYKHGIEMSAKCNFCVSCTTLCGHLTPRASNREMQLHDEHNRIVVHKAECKDCGRSLRNDHTTNKQDWF